MRHRAFTLIELLVVIAILTILTGLLPALNLSNGALLIVYGVVILVTVSLASDAFSDVASAIRSALGRREPPEPSGGEAQ